MSVSDHFGSVASAYADYRPTYPAQLFGYLAGLTGRHQLAWDVGAGNGQASIPLAAIFSRVVATDLSAAQLAEAPIRANLEYRVAPAEQSGLAAGSADLITVAQAAHWFDLTAFYAEVGRVLAPGGVLALWSYGTPHLADPALDGPFQHWNAAVIGPWWPAERRLVDEGYRTIPFPFPERQPPELTLTIDWTLPQLLGYATTWSAVGRYRAAKMVDPVPGLGQSLADAWGHPELARRVRWPLRMRVSA